MKRYILFAESALGGRSGGWHGFVGAYDTLTEAIDAGELERCNWYHIVDTGTLEVVQWG